MAAAPIPNIWHLRTVADTAAKTCFICFKPSPKVLITPDNKDFFYVCASHLSDTGFASPIVDADAEAAKRKKAEMDREIQKVIQEYEEKQKRKKAKKKSKEDKDKKDEKQDDEDDTKAKKERDEKINAIQKGSQPETEDIPRIYALQRNFYQMRIDRIRNIELAKRNQQRLKDPSFFPSAPQGDLT